MAGRGGRGERRERERESEGCDMISILKLSQGSIGNHNSGKRSNLSPLNSVVVEGKKQGRKRKALSNRYTSSVHPKRRKLGLTTIKDNACVHPIQRSNHDPLDLKDFDAIKGIAHVLKSGEPGRESADLKDLVDVKAINDIACVLAVDESKHDSPELETVDAINGIVCVLPIDDSKKEPSDLKELVSFTSPKPRPRGRPRKACTKGSSVVDTEVNLEERLKIKPSTAYSGLSPEVLNSDLSNLKAYRGEVPNSEKKLDLFSIPDTSELREKRGAISGILDTYQKISDSLSNRKGTVKVQSCSKSHKETSFKSEDEDTSFPNDFEHEGVDRRLSNEGELNRPLTPQQIINEKNYSSNTKLAANSGTPRVQGNGTLNRGIPCDGRSLRPRKWMKREPENKLLPADYVGKRVVVYWPHAKAWFAGIVVEYDERSKKHKINYDDSDEECISFRRHKVMLEEPMDVQSIGDGYTAEEEDIFVQKSGSRNYGRDIKQCGNRLEDGNVIEESGILTSFSPSRQPEEVSVKSMYSGLAICPSKEENCSSTDDSVTEGFHEKDMHENVTSVTVAGMDMHDADRDKKIEFVYVRRPKARKVQVPSADRDSSIIGVHKPDLIQIPSGKDNSDQLEEVRQHAVLFKGGGLPLLEHKNQLDSSKVRKIPLLPTNTSFSSGADGKPYDQLDSSNTWNVSSVPADINAPSGPDVNLFEYTSKKRDVHLLKHLVNRTFKMHENKSTPKLLLAKESHDSSQVCSVRRHAKKRMEKMHRFHCFNVNASGHGKLVLKFRKMSSKSSVHSVATQISSMEAEDGEAKIYDDCNYQLLYKSQTMFQITIRLQCPILNADLFTWQFFNILVDVGFAGKASFEDSICIKGSIHDFSRILRLLLSIIKSMSTMSWIYKISHKHWQAQILYQLWTVLSGCASWSDGLPYILPTKAESILVKHLWSACINSKMTARQILNVLVCYFIRPYIISTICEKGALFKAVFEKFVLLKPKPNETPHVQKTVKCFQLQLGHENADSVFSSYLMQFLELKDCFSEKGIFLEQMKKWVASASVMGYSKLMAPVPAVGRPDHLVLQVMTVYLCNRLCSSSGFEKKAVLMKHDGANFHNFYNKLMLPYLCSLEADGMPPQRTISANGHDNLYSALHLMLLLNRNLHHRNQRLPEAAFYHQGRDCEYDKAHLSETCSPPMKKGDARSKVIAVPMDNLEPKNIKLEPDVNISRRSSSITTDSNSIQAIKEESSVEMYGQKLLLDSNAQEPDLKGLHDIRLSFKEELSGQVDNDYYVHMRKRDAKKGKNRAHRNDEVHQNRMKMTRYAVADLVIKRDNATWKGTDAKVKLQLTKHRECFVVVNQGGDMYVQKVEQGSNVIPSNPPQLIWRSDDDWALEFSDKGQWDVFRRMYNGFVQRSAQALPVKSLPIPGIKLIENDALTRPGSFSRPRSAIIQTSNEIESALRNNRVLYDLDSEDEAWLDEYNKEQNRCNEDNNSNTKACITDDVLERVIDLLEKQAYRQKEDSMGDNEDCIEITDALRLYQDLAPAGVVEAVHTYWLTKRRKKGKALVRHFQPPPREQYEKELKNWEMMIAECPLGQQKMLMERFPRPQISAFCLECKDSVDRSKKMLRQRSQKKLKPSRSSSEDSHRAVGFPPNDYSAWHLSSSSRQSRPTFTPCRSQGQVHGKEVSENVQKARAKAIAARKVAMMKTAKFRKRFLDFDATLQKAWALLIEYEASMGSSDLMAQSEAMKAKIELLFSWCSHAMAQGNKSSSDDEPPSDVTRPLGEDFLESFTNKCSILEEINDDIEVAHESEQMLKIHGSEESEQMLKIHESEESEQKHVMHEARELGQASARDAVLEEVETSPLLPISTKGYPYAWIGSTLLQKVDQE